MPNRILRESITTSETIERLSPSEEVFFYRLLVVCDDYGLMDARPAILKAKCFPLRESASQKAIEQWLSALQAFALIKLYEVDGKPFLSIDKWDQHQRVRNAKPKHPKPDVSNLRSIDNDLFADENECMQPAARAVARASLDSDSDSDKDSKGGAGGKGKTAFPADFAITDAMRTWAKDKGFSRLEAHLEHFRDSCRAKDYRYKDWEAAFKNAVRNDWAKLHGKSESAGKTLEQLIAEDPKYACH